MSTVIAVVGTIAGAGTTTVATSLGTALGEQRRRVALVDATGVGSRIRDSIDVDGAGEVIEALRRGTTVADVQGTGPHDVAVFPADSETNWGAVRPDAVGTFYEELRERFEFVVVDCGCSLSISRTAWLGHADEAVIVTDPDVADWVTEPAALANTFEVPVRGVLANRVPHKEVDDALDALAVVDAPVLGVLPEDPTVGTAAAEGASVLRAEPDSPIATCVWEFALRVPETDHDEPVVPPGAATSGTDRDDDSTAGGDADGSATARNRDERDEAQQTESKTEAPDEIAEVSDDYDGTPAQPERKEEGEKETSTTERSEDEPIAAPAPTEAGFEPADPRPVEQSETAVATPAKPIEDATDDAGSTDTPTDADAIADPNVDTVSGASGDGGSTGIDVDESSDANSDEGLVGGSDEGADPDDDSAELSDDEIEAAFQETMQRVQECRDGNSDAGSNGELDGKTDE